MLEQVGHGSDVYMKTTIVLAVAEYDHEVKQMLSDLRERSVDITTLG